MNPDFSCGSHRGSHYTLAHEKPVLKPRIKAQIAVSNLIKASCLGDTRSFRRVAPSRATGSASHRGGWHPGPYADGTGGPQDSPALGTVGRASGSRPAAGGELSQGLRLRGRGKLWSGRVAREAWPSLGGELHPRRPARQGFPDGPGRLEPCATPAAGQERLSAAGGRPPTCSRRPAEHSSGVQFCPVSR